MKCLNQEQVQKLQYQLLKSPGPKLINFGTSLVKPNSGKVSFPVFKQFVMSRLSQKQNKMFLRQVKQVIDNPNSNLQTISIILFKIIFQKDNNEDILYQIKARLYSPQLDLKIIKEVDDKNFSSFLSNKQMKKLLSEFFDCLKYSNVAGKVQSSVKNSPIALQIFVIFLRTLLVSFKTQKAQNYGCSVKTEDAFEQILQIFDIYYTKKQNIYFFNDHGYFIQCGYKDSNDKQINQFLFGNYFENQRAYRQSIQQLKQSIQMIQSKKYAMPQQEQASKFQTQQKQKINPFHLIVPPRLTGEDSKSSKNSLERLNFINSSRSKSSMCLQQMFGSNCDNPTPSFNQVSQDQINLAIKQGNAFQINLKTSQTNSTKNKSNKPLNLVLRSSILDDTIPQSQTKTKKPLKVQSLGFILKGSAIINPKNSGNICKFHNSKGDIQKFDSPATNSSQKQQKQIEFRLRKFSQYNQTHFEHVSIQLKQVHLNEQQKKIMKRSQSEKNSLIIKEETQITDQKKGLFGINCKQLKKSVQFQQYFQFGSQKPKKNPNSFTVGDQSYYSCSCSVFKLKKNKIESNVLQVVCKPQFNFKKKGLFQHIELSKEKKDKIKKAQNLSFLNNIQARKMEIYKRKNYSKNKSQHKSVDIAKKQKPSIKYSQFILPREKSKTPSKSPLKKKSISPKSKVFFSYKKNDNLPQQLYFPLTSSNNKSFNTKKIQDSKYITPTSSFGVSSNVKSNKDKKWILDKSESSLKI